MKRNIIILIVAIVIVLIGGFFVWIYSGTLSGAKTAVVEKLALPVAWVDRGLISGSELFSRYRLAETLAGADESFQPSEVKAQILDQLVETTKLEILADQHGVNATPESIDAEFRGLILQYGGGDEAQFSEQLQQAYGLSTDEFKEKVIRPSVLQSSLATWYNGQESLNPEAYATKRELVGKLTQGQSFDEVAKVYTQDEATKQFAGDTGFVAESELLPEFTPALQAAKAGDRIELASRFGLHIMNVVEVDRGGEEPRYHLQQIFVQPNDFQKWYDGEATKIKARKLVKFN